MYQIGLAQMLDGIYDDQRRSHLLLDFTELYCYYVHGLFAH